MDSLPIIKNVTDLAVPPRLSDYEAVRRSFTWEQARGALDGLPNGRGLNIAHEAVDRHAGGERASHVAIRWLARDGRIETFSYAELGRLTSRFANALSKLGLAPGDRVFALLGRVPPLYVAALGALKGRFVFSPLFAAFGPEPIRQRMAIGGAKALITTPNYYRRKVAPVRGELTELKHVILVGANDEATDDIEGAEDYDALCHAALDAFEIPATDPEDIALLHFTSGTTGTPKGAVHVHAAVVAHRVTGQYALDLHPEDVFWCTADPGWVTGMSYGIISPLTNGVTMIVDEDEFDAERWYGVLQDQKVSVWYTAPTAVRMMMRLGTETPRRHDLSALRFIASVGEPLNPEAVNWGVEAFGLPIHDNWWQTETGGIMIANYAAMDIRPGSMGKPLPGIEASIVEHQKDSIRVIDAPDIEGELALKPGWPSMFRGYLDQEDRYRKCFADGWYLTGDLARRDADGYFWFVGRADDVIKSAGHLIGPFEVESVLMEHEAVAEAGVIGKPDPTIGESVKAFVALKPGFEADDALRRAILGHARKRLGPAVAPREIEFKPGLPKTRSGKIMRRLLKARELGLPEGDLSTLEGET